LPRVYLQHYIQPIKVSSLPEKLFRFGKNTEGKLSKATPGDITAPY
jgi:hypothetical protein